MKRIGKLALGLLHGRVRGGGSEGGVDTAHARWGSPKHLGALPRRQGARTPRFCNPARGTWRPSGKTAVTIRTARTVPHCTPTSAPVSSGEIRAGGTIVLQIGNGTLILRGAEGIGLCNRRGLDCELGRWAINTGPRNMISENLRRAGFSSGCWLLEIGVENGEELAKHTLNSHLGIMGGISLLGTTGLVRPYSHEAYIHTVRICVKSHFLSGGSTMVFCTGGRTKSGAELHLPQLPATAFVSIGDFIAESLAAACRYGMREIAVACMPGKLCKYAAGFENTHAHKVSQDYGSCSAPKSAGRSPPRRACMEHSSTALPCARRFCPFPRTPGTASSAALRGPPSGNSRAAARVTRPSACSCSILKEGSSLKKRGEGPKRPLPGSPQPSRRNRTNT